MEPLSHRYTWILLALVLPLAAEAREPESRSGNPERSALRYFRGPGTFFVEGYLGAAFFDIEPDNSDENFTPTDLLSGFSFGYQLENGLGAQLGYGHVADQDINFFSGGVRNNFKYGPFDYYFSIEAELYNPSSGASKFGIVPGANGEVAINEHLQMGLRFQHDFIFAADNISVNRLTTQMQFKF